METDGETGPGVGGDVHPSHGGAGETRARANISPEAALPAAPLTATAAIRQLFSTEDPSALFRQLDEDYIKPKLLLDGGGGRGGNSGAGPS